MASAISIGLSGLTVNQQMLDLAGQNISNANTPGYHRQVAELAMRSLGQKVGAGVEITQVRRIINNALENAITQNTFSSSDVATQLDAFRQIEAQLNPGEGSLFDLMEKFFNQAETLSGQPTDMAQRRVLLSLGADLTSQFNTQVESLRNLKSALDTQVSQWVNDINSLGQRIAELNRAVQRNTIGGTNASDLSDQRDRLIQQLAELADVKTISQEFGSVNVFVAGVPLVLNSSSLPLQSRIDNHNQVQITLQGQSDPLRVNGGKLAGALYIRNEVLPEVANHIDSLAQTLVQNIDAAHATGIGLTGPFHLLYGQRAVANVAVPLSQAGLTIPAHAGKIYVSVTDAATGQRTVSEVAIDPAVQSLQDVAASLSGIPHLQAVVDTQNRTLTLIAQPGYSFDFANHFATGAENLALGGTSLPAVQGVYSGTNNDTYSFNVVGSGTVGVSTNLTLEARNGAGDLIASWNIGQGYEPGSALSPLQGVRVSMAAGTVNAGDSFTTRVVADSDTAGLLPALGINSFFVGGPGTYQVRADLLAHPELIAASQTGEVGDGANLRAMAALRDQKLLANGSANFRDYYSSLVAEVGSHVEDLNVRQTAQTDFGQRLEAQRQGISGVDPNEELVRMLQFQKAYQFSGRYLAVIKDTLDELLRLV